MLYFLWHGGPNYAVPYVTDHTETAPSRASLLRTLRERASNSDGWTPNVADSSAYVYLSDPRESDDPYPDYVIAQGPRGGFKVERV